MCLSVISEMSGIGGRSATLLAPTWNASPGKLQRLLLESTRHMVQEKKPSELFCRQCMKPHPSRYNGTILRKFVIFLKSVQLFRHQLGCSREEGLCCVGSFAKAWWKLWRSGNGLWGLGNGLWLANHYRPRKGHCRLPQDAL